MTANEIADLAAGLADMARECGFVVSISQKSVEPLAMGNTADVVEVTPLRMDGKYHE